MEAKLKATSSLKLSSVCKEHIHHFIQKKRKKEKYTNRGEVYLN